MSELFYEREIVALIRSNELLRYQLKALKAVTAKLTRGFLTLLNSGFKSRDGANLVNKFLGMSEAELVTVETMARMIEVVENMQWGGQKNQQEKVVKDNEQNAEKVLVNNMEKVLGQLLKASQWGQQESLLEKNKQNMKMIEELQGELSKVKEKQQSYKKSIKTLNSISKQLESELIEANYVHAVQKRTMQKEIGRYKQEIQRLNKELNKVRYSYERLCEVNNQRQLDMDDDDKMERSTRSKM